MFAENDSRLLIRKPFECGTYDDKLNSDLDRTRLKTQRTDWMIVGRSKVPTWFVLLFAAVATLMFGDSFWSRPGQRRPGIDG